MSDIKKNSVGRPLGTTKYREEMCEQAYEALRTGGTLSHVAVALDVSRETLYQWMKKYPDLSDTIKKGMEHAQILWMESKINEMPPGPWVFSMKNLFDWTDKAEVTGKDRGPIQTNSKISLDVSSETVSRAARAFLIAEELARDK